ncbi:hypothetical protein FB451DRAFT_1308947 [Mycena latifolia]|nr:hypothetical protein FB451DRAFT_1308947 [Mycena latifolia]
MCPVGTRRVRFGFLFISSYPLPRREQLTHLLQNSLSGNSKTLMVVNRSRVADVVEALTFATKVNNTTIGTATKVQVPPGKS